MASRTLGLFGAGDEGLVDDGIAPAVDQGLTPAACERRLTDPFCCAVFVALLGLLAYVMVFAASYGNPSFYYGLPDYRGQVCGFSQDTRDKPLLYICKAPAGGALDLDHPVCVASCPSDSTTRTLCPRPSAGAGALAEVEDYPSAALAGRLCLPSDPGLEAQATGQTWNDRGMWLFFRATQVSRAWGHLLAPAMFAFMLGFLHLFLLRRLGFCFVRIGIVVAVLLPLALGIRMIVLSQTRARDSVGAAGNSSFDLMAGLGFVGGACLLLCASVSAWRSMRAATECIKAAGECILDTPSLLLEPFVALAGKGGLFLLLAHGLLLLLSCGTAENEGKHLSEVELYVPFYVLMFFWIMEMCNATSQFVVAYTTEEWFFSPYDRRRRSKNISPWVACKAYLAGLRYHFGSFCAGGFLVPLARLPRMLLALVQQVSVYDNPVSKCLGTACECCLHGYSTTIQGFNRNAYAEIALNSGSFLPSADRAQRVLEHEATAALELHGASWLFELSGVGGITAAGAAVTHLLSHTWPLYYKDGQPIYAEDPVFLDVVSAAICFLVSTPFLLVAGHVSDSILFCIAADKWRNPLRTIMVEQGALGFLSCCGKDPEVEDYFDRDAGGQQPPDTLKLLGLTRR